MSDLSLQILQPAHGAGFAGATPVPLQGAVTGDSTGIFFKWFSSLNSLATAVQPELNTADHSATILKSSATLAEFGSHVIVLAAADQDGIDLASVKAVKRAAMAGGAPPAASLPCVIHRLVARIFTPAADGQLLSKAAPVIEILPPAAWVIEDPGHPGTFIRNEAYLEVNGISLALHLAPTGPPDPAHSADIPLDLATRPFVRKDDPSDSKRKAWLQWTEALPANLITGSYILTLSATGGRVSTSASRTVILTA